MVYCSTECQMADFTSVYQWEHGLLDVIDNDQIGRMATLAYR